METNSAVLRRPWCTKPASPFSSLSVPWDSSWPPENRKSWVLSYLPLVLAFVPSACPLSCRSPLAPSPQELMAGSTVPTSSSGSVWPWVPGEGLCRQGAEGRGQGSSLPFSDVPAAEPKVPEARRTRDRIDGVKSSIPLPHSYCMSRTPDSPFPLSSAWLLLPPSHRHWARQTQLTLQHAYIFGSVFSST